MWRTVKCRTTTSPMMFKLPSNTLLLFSARADGSGSSSFFSFPAFTRQVSSMVFYQQLTRHVTLPSGDAPGEDGRHPVETREGKRERENTVLSLFTFIRSRFSLNYKKKPRKSTSTP